MASHREFEVCELCFESLEDGSLAGYRLYKLPVTTLNMNALKGNVTLSRKEIDRCKNFFALGVLYWLYDRPMRTRSIGSPASWQDPELAKPTKSPCAPATTCRHYEVFTITTQLRRRRLRRQVRKITAMKRGNRFYCGLAARRSPAVLRSYPSRRRLTSA